MPVQSNQSPLLKKLGARLDAAVKAHADDETKYGIIQVPPGINNGIAKLIDAKLDQYKTGKNKGEWYLRLAGVILEPDSIPTAQGIMKVAGLQTSQMVAICDTKTNEGKVTTLEEHISTALNEMRKLGGDEFTKGKTGADLEPMVEALKEAAPFFKFTTAVRKAQTKDQTDGVWENWFGGEGLEEYVPPEGSEQLIDNTVPAVDTAGEAATGGDDAAATSGEQFSEFGDIDSLAERADTGKDPAAVKELIELGTKVGLDDPTMEAAKTYKEVAEMIKATSGEAPPAEEPAAEFLPAKGDPFKMEIDTLNAKKQKVKKKIDIEVLTVDVKAKTVTVKDTATQKPVLGADKKPQKVSWDSLLATE